MERDGCLLVSQHFLLNFNSHAHVERDVFDIIDFFNEFRISTHTLTWSVTRKVKKIPIDVIAFQLTRSRGA